MASPHFCTNCGTSLPGAAKFCGDCGHQTQTLPAVPVSVAATAGAAEEAPAAPVVTSNGAGTVPAVADESPDEQPTALGGATTEPFAAATAPAPPRPPAHGSTSPSTGGSLLRWLVPALVAIVIAGVVAVLLLTSGTDAGADAGAAYRKQVAEVFGPVLGANKQLSRSLLRLRGTDPVTARADVQLAQQATTAAQGALVALPVPASESKLAGDARQVIDRQVAYLSVVSAVLKRPAATGAGELQTLSSNLTSALSAAGPTVAGAAPTVTGTDRLVSWAPQAVRKLRREAQRKARAAKRSREPADTNASAGGSRSAPSSNPYTSGSDCGNGTYAGPNTSCEFARNVRDAYNEAPGERASVRVFSPVTGQTYTISCAPSGSGITCSGANNASVTF